MSPALRSHFADYAAFHATRGNQATHYVGVPMIVLSVFALLSHVPVASVSGFTITLAELLLAGATAYYLVLDAPLALMMAALSIAMILLGRQLPIAAGAGLFVVGWAFQFVGHFVYEKKSPAFLRNLAHLLVGPLWILAKATGRA